MHYFLFPLYNIHNEWWVNLLQIFFRGDEVRLLKMKRFFQKQQEKSGWILWKHLFSRNLTTSVVFATVIMLIAENCGGVETPLTPRPLLSPASFLYLPYCNLRSRHWKHARPRLVKSLAREPTFYILIHWHFPVVKP